MNKTNSNMTIAKKAGICAFTLIFVAIGLTLMRSGFNDIQKAKASVSWPQTNGKIITSELESNYDGDRRMAWFAKIVYNYVVDGTEMKGDQVAIGDYGSGNISHAQKIVGTYPVDKEVKVYYNPKDSTECLLEPGLKGQSYAMFGGGFAFFAVGSLFFGFALKIPMTRKDEAEYPDPEDDVEES